MLLLFRIARADWSQGRRCQALGSWGSGKLGRVGQLGEGWGKQGQFTSNLRWRRTIPVTAGGCQVSESGVQGGVRGTERGSKRNCAMYICKCNVCAKE
jgi:hypothetical protein